MSIVNCQFWINNRRVYEKLIVPCQLNTYLKSLSQFSYFLLWFEMAKNRFDDCNKKTGG